MTTNSKNTIKTTAIIAGTVIAVFAVAIIAVIAITNRIAPQQDATPTPENLTRAAAGESTPTPEPEPLPALDNESDAMRHGLSNIARCTGGIQTYSYGTMREVNVMGIIATDPLGDRQLVANFTSDNGQIMSIYDPASLSADADAEMTTGGKAEPVAGSTEDAFFTLGLTTRQAEKFGRLESVTLTHDGARIGECEVG